MEGELIEIIYKFFLYCSAFFLWPLRLMFLYVIYKRLATINRKFLLFLTVLTLTVELPFVLFLFFEASHGVYPSISWVSDSVLNMIHMSDTTDLGLSFSFLSSFFTIPYWLLVACIVIFKRINHKE